MRLLSQLHAETSTDDVATVDELAQAPEIGVIHHQLQADGTDSHEKTAPESAVNAATTIQAAGNEALPPHYDDAVGSTPAAVVSAEVKVAHDGAETAGPQQHEGDVANHLLIASPETRIALADEKPSEKKSIGWFVEDDVVVGDCNLSYVFIIMSAHHAIQSHQC